MLKRLAQRITTRFEKLKAAFEGFLHLAIVVQHLRRQFNSTPFPK